jgi:DDE superfamily endonuclease
MSTTSINDDDVDIVFVTSMLLLLEEELEEIEKDTESLLMAHIREQQRLNRSLPVERKRLTWIQFCSRVTPRHFKRMFRMTRESFDTLCKELCEVVGEKRFRPQILFPPSEEEEEVDKKKKIPRIAGEVKLANSLRMIAGGSYLNLVPLFDLSTSHVYKVLHQFIRWVLRRYEFPLVKWLRERRFDLLAAKANDFAEKTDGVFYGPFAANDGWAVKIKAPTLEEVSDPGNYYCRKGFYALNVQAMCDRRKKFLWVYPSNKGATHDSAAFAGSKLYELLKEMSPELQSRGLFIVGDSAYGLTPFLMVPYDQDELKEDVNGAKDSFNYHLSSCRIYIECAFGELVMRWGIFWRTLLFDLKKSANIVQVCMLFHNFILDHERSDPSYFQDFAGVPMDNMQLQVTEKTGEIPRAIVTDNNELNPGGRPSAEEIDMRFVAEEIRHRMTLKFATHDLRRPLHHDMHYNANGNIYMTS